MHQMALLLITVLQLVVLMVLHRAAATHNITTQQHQPHIVFILVDDLGFNDVSWHNPGVVMPNIAALASTGVVLEQSYVLAVCTPTRAALLTGRYPYTIGRQSSALKPMRPTGLTLNATLLPETLRGVGYKTHMVGKWHLGFCNWEYTPTYRGFDSFLGFYVGGQQYYTHVRGHSPKMSRGGHQEFVSGYDYRLNTQAFHPPQEQYSTFAYASRAREIIAQHPVTEPLFLYLPFQAVHGPTQAPQPYVQLYAGVRHKKRRTYLGMVTALDDAVGSIVDALKDAGLYNNSVIVFTTDNGGGVKTGGNNWPLRGHKSTLFEGGVRGPAFVHSPILKRKGTTYNGLMHVVDWYATLAGLAGARTPEHLDSLDMWPSISEGKTSMRSQIVYNIADNRGKLKAAIRVKKFKLVIGETRGFEIIEPPEGEMFRVTNAQLLQFQFNENRTRDLRTMRRTFFHNITASTGSQLEQRTAIFPLSKLSPEYDQAYDYTQRLEDNEYEHEEVNCDELSKKECRQLNREQINLRSFKQVDDFFNRGLDIRLYNLQDDPREEVDLSLHRPLVVRRLLRALLKEMPRVVLADNPPRVSEANPDNFGGMWSPGWC